MNPHGAPDRVLVGARRLLAQALALVDAGITVDDWSATQPAIDLEECAALLFRTRTEVLVAIRAAAFERTRLRQTKVRRRNGSRPQAWMTRDAKGRITGFENAKEIAIEGESE